MTQKSERPGQFSQASGPRQSQLPFQRSARPRPKTIPRLQQGFDAANLEAARIVLSDPNRYGEASGLAIWARMVIIRAHHDALPKGLQGRLFHNEVNS